MSGAAVGFADVHPALRRILDAAAGQRELADLTVAEAREAMRARTLARARGPDVAEVRDIDVPTAAGNVPVRLYRPKGAQGLVIAAHGGGWLMGNRDSFDATARSIAHLSGQAVLSVDYRLAPEHPFPAAFDDFCGVLAWAAKHAVSLGLSPERLAVLGDSAGGNLAAAACLFARDQGVKTIRAQVLVYPAVDARLTAESLRLFPSGYLQTERDVRRAFATYGLGSVVQADDWRLSPLLAANHSNLPPALVISAGLDAMRDDAINYTAKLLEAGSDAIHVCYPNVVHTFFGMRGTLPDADHAHRLAAQTLRDAIG